MSIMETDRIILRPWRDSDAEVLHDSDDRVRMEAPEMFRVLGKRRPEFVQPYLEQLRHIAETDTNRVVRIHCEGAIRASLQPECRRRR